MIMMMMMIMTPDLEVGGVGEEGEVDGAAVRIRPGHGRAQMVLDVPL
jgi:hypothetical protein